jgi:hypothetical protein
MSAINPGPRNFDLVMLPMIVMPLLAGMVLAVPVRATGSPGNLERCAQWRRAQGVEKAALANQLGAANQLTKNQRLAEAQPDETRSLYRTSDLQRLCRTP